MNTVGMAAATLGAAAIVAGAVLAPPIMNSRALQELRTNCWTEATKKLAETLATDLTKEQLVSFLASEQSSITKAQINAGTTVTLTDFHLRHLDAQAGVVTCGATLAFAFKRQDGKTVRNRGSILEFSVHPSGVSENAVAISNLEVFKQVFSTAKVGDPE